MNINRSLYQQKNEILHYLRDRAEPKNNHYSTIISSIVVKGRNWLHIVPI